MPVTKSEYETGSPDSISRSTRSGLIWSSGNRWYASSLETSAGVTQPPLVRSFRLYQRATQWVSGVIAINGWASTMRCNSVVPDRGQPTMNRYGLPLDRVDGSAVMPPAIMSMLPSDPSNAWGSLRQGALHTAPATEP